MKGTYTAIVTPFNDNGIDFEALKKVINFQKEAGVTGLIIAGTTGEAATMSFDEKEQLFSFVVKHTGNLDLVAGTGTNDTASSVALTKMALRVGIEKVLVVTPYYNKPSCAGLFRHYSEVAATGAKIVLYNVPGRTALHVAPDCLKKLAEIKNIIAVKEASGSVANLIEYQNAVGADRFDFLSGDDFTVVPFISMGGKGVISVFTNVIPKKGVEMINEALNGNFKRAGDIQREILDFNNAMFMETNPLPVKTAMVMKGFMDENFRAPLAPMLSENKKKLEKVLRRYDAL
ncbi:4-hydroxy-tetrahydrodipicolinate synthase [bacterium]|nr:4-hydroxy-tetrahydrodipicolinate synthase [bacterium]